MGASSGRGRCVEREDCSTTNARGEKLVYSRWRAVAVADGGAAAAAAAAVPHVIYVHGNSSSRAEALDILGLEEGASEDEIEAAYKGLIVKNHPDQGGTDWLAARINEARDILLGN